MAEPQPLKDIPNRDAVVDDANRVMTRPWLQWVTDLRTSVNRLIEGTFDGNVTAVNGTFTGVLTAASAVIAGAITAASATLSGALTAASASLSGALSAASATLTGALTAASAVISGAITAASLTLSGGTTLSAYIEGTFTPTSPNIAYAAAGMKYQKIGTWVHCSGFLVFPATADANQAAINNLPFTSENSTEARGGAVSHFSNAGASVGLLVLNNSTTAQLFTPTTGVAVTNAALTGVSILFDFKYRAAA